MQHTLSSLIHFRGVGLHGGQSVAMIVRPAPAHHGIHFVRTDVKGKNNIISALLQNVSDTKLCTVISNEDGVTVGTIEHLMAALQGCHVDNALIELNGPEVPIMDGSSAVFVHEIERVGLQTQDAPRHVIRILKTISVHDGDKIVTLSPADQSAFSGEIDFNHPMIGRQTYQTTIVNGNFPHELADCRTFGFEKEVNYMRSIGLARGGSLDNAIVLGEDNILNPTGLRRPDEFIRHKLLDAVGDLALAGAPIQGRYHGVKAGHEMNNRVLRALFADDSAWEWTTDNIVPFAAQEVTRYRDRSVISL
jgi:UDP-3-O-[3-hydroxymyristoyl] N-acetylglucosamine deacetylase